MSDVAFQPAPFDLVVAGAGIVGLATALAVRRRGARVVLCDPALAGPAARTLRAVAVAAGPRRFLASLGVWDAVAPGAQSIAAMDLTDAPPGALPAPVFLGFAGETAAGEPIAHMVLHDDLRDALRAACAAAGVMLRPCAATGFEPTPDTLEVIGAGAERLAGRLLVAADGGRSYLREAAGIGVVARDYDQAAVVATLAHDRDHGGRAVQHFLPGGPLALLPMRSDDGTGRRTSIVWTERRPEAERLAGLDAPAFVAALERLIGHGLGSMRLEDRPQRLPLRLSLARTLVAPRLALVGDAARTIHPLAGQGLNLGLRDAAALADAVGEALRLGLDPGAPDVLKTYERARRADAVAMAVATDLLNRLFSNDSAPVRLIRDLGLGLVDRAPGLKRWFMTQAAGRD